MLSEEGREWAMIRIYLIKDCCYMCVLTDMMLLAILCLMTLKWVSRKAVGVTHKV